MKIAVYGTLRKDGRLHDYINDEPLGIDKLEGWSMYSIQDSYPYVVNTPGEILVEVYELGAETAERVAQMEQGAGYGVAIVDTKYGAALLFYNNSRGDRGDLRVESGDWIEHKKGKRVENAAGNIT